MSLRLYKFGAAIRLRNQIIKANKRQIKNLYKQIYKDLDNEIQVLKYRTNISSILRTQELYKLKNQVIEAFNNVDPKLEQIIVNGMSLASMGVVKDAQTLLNHAGLKIQGAYSHVPEDVVARISTGRVYQPGWSLSKSIWKDTQKIHSEIDTVIAKGVAEQKSTYAIAKELEKYVNPSAKKPWDWGKVYPGCRKQIDYNAQRLARTLVNHAYQQSIVQTCQGNPFITGIQWIADGGERTCPICMERDGHIYPVDEVPLDHPNGLCTQAAVMAENVQEIAEQIAEDTYEETLGSVGYTEYKQWRDKALLS